MGKNETISSGLNNEILYFLAWIKLVEIPIHLQQKFIFIK
tara:strand:- start:500 stop:619 length:120 start_codon:yes stop_codon:yes gene_type:complete